VETVTDFVKNCGLLDLFVIVVTLILILAGILILIVGRSRRVMFRLLVVAFVPLLLGLLDMFVKNRFLDRRVGLMGPLSTEAVAAGRRDAMLIACIGATGTVMIVLIGFLGLALKKNVKA